MSNLDEENVAGNELSPEDIKAIIHPIGVMNGIMKADPEKCKHCGLCVTNCPMKCWEMDKDRVPMMKKEYTCFSCFNCMIACPEGAVSVEQTFSVRGGFFDTDFPPVRPPLEPRDGQGNPASWTEMERTIMERRSVRNFRKDPVSPHLIRRILEAGRFAPSAANAQPWKFTVITDPGFHDELENACQMFWANMAPAFQNDEAAMGLYKQLPAAVFDPRVQRGIACVAKKELPVFMNAPVIIIVGSNTRMSFPELHAGICGQNMNLAAMALGLGAVWCNFGTALNFIPELKLKLGFPDPLWVIQTTLCIGYPSFKQQGTVARHSRPVTWFGPGAEGEEQ
ncbi:MAG: NADH dehydrogenase [Syntrophorhabdaceae bacterium PtaU1.Bin034]|nr:MAG: NADH dehydrogenase [Syntrophorhabdaceae bacterium PtaU1.Bin034]